MDKCFEGIQRVMFSEKDEVYGMISAEGEQVELLDKIDVNAGDRKGNVEKWMLDIEYQMKKSLKAITKESLSDYEQSPRTEWVKKWPGQVVISVDCTHWTTGVEKALTSDNENALEEYEQLI
jgi:dynein heavy chain